jgi:hypothetical protein
MRNKLLKFSLILLSITIFTACGETTEPLSDKEIAMNKIVTYSEIGKIKPTPSDYKLIGISNVDNENIELVNASVDATDSKGVSDINKIQSLVNNVVAKYNHAKKYIQNYADSSNNTQPKVSDYKDMGVTGVTNNNLVHINNAIDNSRSYYVDTKSQVQAIVDNVIASL